MAPVAPISLPPLARAVLVRGGAELLRTEGMAESVLQEMIGRSDSRDHARAIYAFNVATTAQGQREAVADFYGYGSAAAAEATLPGMDGADI